MRWQRGRSWTAVLVAGSMLAWSGAAAAEPAPRVRRVAVEGVTPVSTVVAAGKRLVGSSFTGPVGLLSSPDGARWEPVTLPGASPGMEIGGVTRTGPYVTVTGRSRTAPGATATLYAWTTRDGVRWRGGPLPVASRVTNPFVPPLFESVGRTLVGAVTRPDGGLVILTGRGNGRWTASPVADFDLEAMERAYLFSLRREGRDLVATVAPPEPDAPAQARSHDAGRTWAVESCTSVELCSGPGPHRAPGLLVATHTSTGAGRPRVLQETSTDGGRSWSRLAIRPDLPRRLGLPFLGQPARVEGGWVADVVQAPEGDQTYGYLVRSEDGRTWRRIRTGARCHPTGRPNSGYSPVVRAGDHLATTYTCDDLSERVGNAVYVADAAGEDLERVRSIDAHRTLGDALAFRGRILVPVVERPSKAPERVAELLVIEP